MPSEIGNILVAEGLDDLRLAVLEYGESILVEVGDHALLVVDDRGVQQDLLHFGMEDETRRVRCPVLAAAAPAGQAA